MAEPTLQIEFKGVDDIVDNLDLVSNDIQAAINQVIARYVRKIERTAKRNAPVDTGRLRASIRPRLQFLAAEVFTDVEYAPFVEFGTGRRGSQSDIEPPDDYQYGTVAGQAAQPFLRTALDQHKVQFRAELISTLQRML